MTKATDRSGSSNIWLGSKGNNQQSVVYIPCDAIAGAGAADKPGLLFLESIDADVGTLGGLYLYAHSDNTLRYSTSYPTDEDAGTTIGAVGATYATKALDNLATVRVNTDLLDGTKGTHDIGSSSLYFKDFYFGGDVYAYGTTLYEKLTFAEPSASSRTINFPDPGANVDVIYTSTSQALTTKTYNGLTIVAGSDAISLTEGTATIAVAAAADINLAAAANVDFGASGVYNFVGDIDIDTAAAVDINANFSIATSTPFTISGGGAIAIDQDLQASASPTFVAITCQGITNTSTVIDTTAQLQVGADNVSLTFGDDNDTDSEIYFDGSDLRFFDGGTRWTLGQLASGTTLNPTVTGSFTITDGNNTWSNTATDEIAVWTLAATTVDGIDIVSANTTAAVLSITADATANGTLLYLDADGGVGASGYFIECYDATDSPFLVGQGGALTMASTSNISNKISRNNASGATPVLEIEETNAAGDVALLVDSDHSGAIDAMQITYAGTEYGLNITGGNVAGGALKVVGPASQTAPLILVDGNTGAGWIGAATVGMIQIENDANIANADAHVIQLDNTGSAPTGITGASIHVTDASTGGGGIGSAVYINSSGALSALHIATGVVDIDTYVDIDGYVAIDASDALNQHALVITQADTDGSKDGLQISFASAGYGLSVTNTKVDGTNAVFKTGVGSTTSSNIVIDGQTIDWIGNADDTGMVQIIHGTTAVAHVGGTLLRVSSDAIQKASAQGTLARFECLGGSAQAGAVAVEIVAKDKTEYALNVGAGMVKVTDWVLAGGMHYNVTDVTATDAGLQLTDKYGFYTFDETTGDNGDILLLPAAVAGMEMWLQNIDGAQAVEVTPFSGEQINALGADAAVDIIAGELLHVICSVTGHWRGNIYSADGTITKAT